MISFLLYNNDWKQLARMYPGVSSSVYDKLRKLILVIAGKLTEVFLAYRLTQWLWLSLDWLFPPVCAGCKRAGFRWCPDCRRQVKLVPEPVCRACGHPIDHPGLCQSCQYSLPPYNALRSWAVFEGPIRQAIHDLKYRRNVALGDVLARHLVKYVTTLDWQVDMVVPVPLGRQRMKERGYNQAGLLAKPVSFYQHWDYSPQVLLRIRETRTQVGLSEMERRQNMTGAFRADPARVSGKVVLLMDDVATTGATLVACSKALGDAGAKAVYALTLAKALPHHGLLIV
jgi:competence protein ComFC